MRRSHFAARRAPRDEAEAAGRPGRKRANELAKVYTRRCPLSRLMAVSGVVLKAIQDHENDWSDDEITAALDRLADEGWDVTVKTLRIELRKGRRPAREIDPVIHQAIDSALEHLNALDSESMTETERTLAAAVRLVAVAVAHVGTEMAKENQA